MLSRKLFKIAVLLFAMSLSSFAEEDCGPSCRYRKANDNLTLQVLYLMNKLEKVRDESDDSKVFIALKGFCTDAEEQSGDSKECKERYESFQGMALLRLRQAIGTNEDTIARLTSRRQDDGSIAAEGDSIYDAKQPEKIYIPDVPTLKDLENEFRKDGKVKTARNYSKSDMNQWTQQLVLQNPTTDYLEFSKNAAPTTANPTSANSGKLTMLNRENRGQTKTDERATLKQKQYEKEWKEKLGNLKNGVLLQNYKPTSPARVKNTDQISYESFRDARNLIIDKVEGLSGDKKPAANSKSKTQETDLDYNEKIAKLYNDDYRITKPKESDKSYYIRYDLENMFKDIDVLTK